MKWFDGIVPDVWSAARGLRRSPAFALTLIATLGLGIGVNAAVFTVASSVLFKAFPLVRDNDRLLYVTTNKGAVYYPDFEDWRASAKSFDGMALVRGVFKTVGGEGAPESVFTIEATANTFQVLGVKPVLGRDFVASDQQPGAEPVVILRYDFWQRRFGKNPAVVGQVVQLNGVPTTVIGVMPQGFSFPEDQSLWTPLLPTPAALERGGFYARYAFGRLAGSATIEGARAELDAIGRRLASAYPRTNDGVVPVARTFGEWFVGTNATALYEAMWGAVAFVLVIVCGNAANLLLERAVSRSRDISIRLALGAGRWRIIRQLLLESLMLSGLGGALGWWVAEIGVRAYSLAQSAGNGTSVTRVLSFALDGPVLAYVIALSVGAGLLIGFAAALRLTKLDANLALKDRRSASGVHAKRLAGALVGMQIALAVVLLAGAGVMIRSFMNLASANVGVDADNVLSMSLYVPDDRYPDPQTRIAFYDRLEARLAALPGVESVGLGIVAPTESTAHRDYEVADAFPMGERSRPTVADVVVSPGYFRTLHASLLRGREFNALDRASSMPVAIVNERFARTNWPGEDAVGKRLRMFRDGAPSAWLTVVGVAANVVQNDATRQTFEPLVYVPYRQRPVPNMFVFARTRVPPSSLATAFARQVYALDPGLPVPALMPLAERFDRASAFARDGTVLFLTFAGIALLLASVGLYATVAHSVSRRTHEIGIRTAIGASAREIRRLVIRIGLPPLAAGLGTGLIASLAVNRLLAAQLVGVSPQDPVTLVGVVLVLVLAATLGCVIPARRASRVDPVVALRQD